MPLAFSVRRVAPPLASILLLGGCVQFVAFEQPIIGEPDIVEEGGISTAGLCDPDVQMGLTALCTESCEIDPRAARTSCGRRVALDGSRATFDVAGLHEVELTLTVCQRQGRLFRVEGSNGASVEVRDRSLHVLAAAEAEAQPFDDDAFLSGEEEGCEERTLLLQTGRMALTDTGRRLCSAHLVPVDGAWQVEMARESIRSIEVCFRGPD